VNGKRMWPAGKRSWIADRRCARAEDCTVQLAGEGQAGSVVRVGGAEAEVRCGRARRIHRVLGDGHQRGVASITSRPIWLLLRSVNQTLPSGPAVMPSGELPAGRGNSVIALGAPGVMRPILPPTSVNQRLPSGPRVIPSGPLLAIGRRNSVTPFGAPGVTRPILLPWNSVNQRLPSGPAVMPWGKLLAVGMGNSVMALGTPDVIRAMLLACTSVNQTLPFGPAVMPSGELPGGRGNFANGIGGAGGDAPNLIVALSEPQTAVGARGDAFGEAARELEHGNGVRCARRKAPNLIALGEPEVAVRAGGQAKCAQCWGDW
jgi:hypothetical protein